MKGYFYTTDFVQEITVLSEQNDFTHIFSLSLVCVLKCTFTLNSRINEMNLYFGILKCGRWQHLKGFHIYNCTNISLGLIKVAVIAGWSGKNEIEVVDEICYCLGSRYIGVLL